jgi:hypothetical protein
MMLRVVWSYEDSPDLSWLEQWNTPEKYKGNEVCIDGKPVPFEEYMQFWGDPNRHVMLLALVQRVCPTCGQWETIDSLGNVDFMDTASWFVGSVMAEELDGPHQPAMEEYQLELTRELLQAALKGE